MVPVATLVLVHGSWHGGWCWDGVAPLLRGRGHTVLTPDLPGHGADATPASEVAMDTCTDLLGELLGMLLEPALLVGHSFGGAVISQTAEHHPEAVAGLVYLSAFLLRHGQSVWRHGYPSKASQDTVFRPPHLKIDAGNATVDLDPAVIPDAFYNGCTAAAVDRALSLWRPEPVLPLQTPLELTKDRYGRQPRAYIGCLEDRIISRAAQERMCRLTQCDPLLTMPTGHSPFLADPEGLAGILDRLAALQPVR